MPTDPERAWNNCFDCLKNKGFPCFFKIFFSSASSAASAHAMNTPTPLPPLNALRILRIVFYFNIPLVVLYLLFDFWRAHVHGDGGICADFVCAFTARQGDVLPLVSSFTAEAHKRAASVNIALARELLLFNVIIFAAYTVVATTVFYFNLPRLGIIGVTESRKALCVLPFGIAIIVLVILMNIWTPHWPTPGERRGLPNRLLFENWGGVYAPNGRSIFASMFIMLMVLHVFNLAATVRQEFGLRVKR